MKTRLRPSYSYMASEMSRLILTRMPEQWKLTEGSLQYFPQDFLLLQFQLSSLRSQIKNVDGLLSFGVDKSDFNVAIKTRQRRSHVVKQASAVLGDDFEQRALGRRSIVKVDSGRDCNLGRSRPACRFTALQQWLQRGFSAQNICEALLEPFDFAGVQLQRAVQVRKVKC